MYLLTQWSVEHYPASLNRHDQDVAFSKEKIEVQREIRTVLKELTSSPDLIRHILLLTNIRHRGLYNEKKLRKLLGDVNFVEDRERRGVNVKKRMVKIQ